ncbi:MAG: hypothetical protein OK456_10245 [Thaumarchaeota archaeon]|nr:hypothetical protein [Nitrososphaerota archaeon]
MTDRETIVIKGVERQAYRKLKSRAAREGLTMGQAASEAFSGWSSEQLLIVHRIRDPGKMRAAAEIMDLIRSKQKVQGEWSGEKVVREWRDRRR